MLDLVPFGITMIGSGILDNGLGVTQETKSHGPQGM